ncbi:hypothetical protein [Planctomonas psychrotolerans]|uniref:hypothetical protein n=1 Tax=Planctomonas psychrotolerans TaxID=2528712 RepID=UPI00123B7F60|nr:hypothetical protein [Planctomonas psychrotolerans]
MVAHFLRLKLRILGNTFRRSPWQLVVLILGILYGCGVAALGVLGLVALRLVEVDVARTILVIGGSLVVLGFLIVPLVAGVDDTLDPRRFALFGIPNDRLAVGLIAAALLGVPAIVLALVALSTVITWSRTPAATIAGLLSAALIVLTCVLASRVTTSVASLLLSTRRAREGLGVVAVVSLVLIGPAIALIASIDWGSDAVAALGSFADTLGWTPLGAAWAFPADVAARAYGPALLRFLIAGAFAAVLALVWLALVAKMLVTPERAATVKTYGGLGWFDRFRGTPSGAIAARSVTYWIRDPRYRVSLIMIPILPIALFIPLSIVGVDPEPLWLMPLPVMCLFLGWSIHNDVAFDSTAVWQHVASGTPGRADRLGRAAPVILVGVPLILVGSAVSAHFHGDWAVLPSLIGVSTAILFAGIGISSVMSARFPYPAVQPGDSPFQQPQTSGAASALIQLVSFALCGVIAAPAIVLAALGLRLGGDWATWSLVCGVATAVLSLVIGTVWGGRIFERRGPELLAFANRH